MLKSNKSIIIVGAGIGGLATAALLAKEGYSVTVIEKNNDLGGRARVFKASGFTFDMGPSWYMMPEVFEKYYALFGKKSSDFFTLKKLSPLYRVFFGLNEFWDIDEKFLNDKNKLEKIEKGSYKAIQEYQNMSKKLYRLSLDNFLYTDFTTLSSWLKLIKSARHLPPRSLLSLDKLLHLYTKNNRLIQVLSYWAVFLGASPKKIPGIYSLMSHVESAGVYYPDTGMGALVQSFVNLCKENGVAFRTDEEVSSIQFNPHNSVVKTTKQTYLADRVIANADYQFVEEKLLHKKDRTYDAAYWNKKTVAPSMFILYLGIKGKVKNLKHHNFYFTNDWEGHFSQIFDKPSMPDDPSYYICAPSKTDSTVAPKGDENIFVLVPIASGLKDSTKIREEYSEKILKHIESTIGDTFRDRIVYKKIYSINDFANDYNAFKGTALGLTHTLFQTAFFRPKMQSKKNPRLFYVGQYTLPGVGVPMVLISAQVLAAKILKEDEK